MIFCILHYCFCDFSFFLCCRFCGVIDSADFSVLLFLPVMLALRCFCLLLGFLRYFSAGFCAFVDSAYFSELLLILLIFCAVRFSALFPLLIFCGVLCVCLFCDFAELLLLLLSAGFSTLLFLLVF